MNRAPTSRTAGIYLLSLANYGNMARVQTLGAQHAVPVSEVTYFASLNRLVESPGF